MDEHTDPPDDLRVRLKWPGTGDEDTDLFEPKPRLLKAFDAPEDVTDRAQEVSGPDDREPPRSVSASATRLDQAEAEAHEQARARAAHERSKALALAEARERARTDAQQQAKATEHQTRAQVQARAKEEAKQQAKARAEAWERAEADAQDRARRQAEADDRLRPRSADWEATVLDGEAAQGEATAREAAARQAEAEADAAAEAWAEQEAQAQAEAERQQAEADAQAEAQADERARAAEARDRAEAQARAEAEAAALDDVGPEAVVDFEITDEGYEDEDDRPVQPERFATSSSSHALSTQELILAGRSDSLQAALASIALRIDALTSTTSTFRNLISDRVSDYADQVGRFSTSAASDLEDYRQLHERSLDEIRRNVSDTDENIRRLGRTVGDLELKMASLIAAVRENGDAVDHLATERDQMSDTVARSLDRVGQQVELGLEQGLEETAVALARLEEQVAGMGDDRGGGGDSLQRLEETVAALADDRDRDNETLQRVEAMLADLSANRDRGADQLASRERGASKAIARVEERLAEIATTVADLAGQDLAGILLRLDARLRELPEARAGAPEPPAPHWAPAGVAGSPPGRSGRRRRVRRVPAGAGAGRPGGPATGRPDRVPAAPHRAAGPARGPDAGRPGDRGHRRGGHRPPEHIGPPRPGVTGRLARGPDPGGGIGPRPPAYPAVHRPQGQTAVNATGEDGEDIFPRRGNYLPSTRRIP